MGTISKRGREKQAVRDTPGGLRIVYGLGAISGKDTKSSIQRCQIITGRRMEKAVQKAAVNWEVNNCVYNWTSDRKTGRFATANEVKSVTSHEVINIIYFLEKVYEELQSGNEAKENHLEIQKITPITQNAYENSVRYQNDNSENIMTVNEGFMADQQPQNDIREIFRRGWTADKKGAHIGFDIEGSCIGVQYRKSVIKPTCVAQAVVDGDRDNAVILDGNFEETWGDSLHLDTIAEHLPYGKHHVEIELIETHQDDKVPFYLVSVIGS